MILVTNGCSHTAGAELEHVYQRRCYHKAWPKILADKIEYDHVNLSDSGASSHRVVRTTIRYVLDNMKNIRDHFFIINWPGAFRTELKYSDSFPQQDQYLFYDDSWLPMVVGNDKQYKENFSSTLYTVYKSWVLSNNNIQAKIDYLHDILLLQNLFTTYGIKFLFWNASNLFIPNDVPEFDGYRALVHKKLSHSLVILLIVLQSYVKTTNSLCLLLVLKVVLLLTTMKKLNTGLPLICTLILLNTQLYSNIILNMEI